MSSHRFLKFVAFIVVSLWGHLGALNSNAQDQKLPPSETGSGPPPVGDKIAGEGKIKWSDDAGTKASSVEPTPQVPTPPPPVPTKAPPSRGAVDTQNSEQGEQPVPSSPQVPSGPQNDTESRAGDLLLNAEQVSALVKVLRNNSEVIAMADGQDLIFLIGGGVELRIPGSHQSRANAPAGNPAARKVPAKKPTIQRFIDPPELESSNTF